MTDPKQNLKPVYIHEAVLTQNGDEISLVDLALVLIKRKKLIIGITLLFTLAGIALALLTPKHFKVTASITVGSQLVDGQFRSFENINSVLAKTEINFIPYVLSQFHANQAAKLQKRYNISVSIPKGSDILLLQAQGESSDTETLKDLLGRVSQMVITDHQRIHDALRLDMQTQIEGLRLQLAQLGKSPGEKIESRYVQLQIKSLQQQLANLQPTRQILQPMLDDNPTGKNRKLIVIGALIIGLFLSVFAAFFAEFLTKVREKQQVN